MYLVHEKRDNPGRWEVAWMWMPHFLSADRELHRHIDTAMTKEFKGTILEGDSQEHSPNEMRDAVVERMHARVKELVLDKYPIPGLRMLLDSYVHLQPDEENPDGMEEEPR